MKAYMRIFLLILMLPVLMLSDGRQLAARSVSSSVDAERIRFRVVAVEERAGVRTALAATTIEGPPGTDFNIDLQSRSFKMKAHFLTDLIERGRLRVRTKLDTRRFYGYSEQKLPLYEEDEQRSALELNFDEAVVLLPFGRGLDDSDTLKIEITPYASEQAARISDGRPRPLQIEIEKPAPDGLINVEAFKVPHRFTVEAALFEDGVEVARGTVDNLLEEEKELMLQPNAQASAEVSKSPPVVSLSIDQFIRSRPSDQVSIGFNIYRTNSARERQVIASNWSGIGDIGSYLSYDLRDAYQTGRKYELKFRIRLAPGESSD